MVRIKYSNRTLDKSLIMAAWDLLFLFFRPREKVARTEISASPLCLHLIFSNRTLDTYSISGGFIQVNLTRKWCAEGNITPLHKNHCPPTFKDFEKGLDSVSCLCTRNFKLEGVRRKPAEFLKYFQLQSNHKPLDTAHFLISISYNGCFILVGY